MLKAIFFDNDGILVNTEELYFQATREILATVGIDLTPDSYRQDHLIDSRGSFYLAVERGMTAAQVEALRAQRNTRYAGILRTEPLIIDGAERALRLFSGKYILGIVTSSNPEYFDLEHSRTGFLQFINFCITPADYAEYKPGPEPYLRALDRAGVKAAEAIAVEDSQRGLMSAAAAGIRCIVIPTELTKGSDFSRAYAVLGSIDELPAVVENVG
jgi:HAD superfamily hydrolase (TIGR01509 family)